MTDKKFDDTNRFVLFKNDRKEKETDRDYSGSANFEGVDVWLSAWKKKDKNGNPYLSGSIQRKVDKPAKPTTTVKEDMDDEIPF